VHERTSIPFGTPLRHSALTGLDPEYRASGLQCAQLGPIARFNGSGVHQQIKRVVQQRGAMVRSTKKKTQPV
jgi:hypothetical protein